MSDADDTSKPFVPDDYFGRFLDGKEGHPSQADYPSKFLPISAEMNRRLAQQQGKLLAAQNDLLKSQEKTARSLKNATWVLSITTAFLAAATIYEALRAAGCVK